MPPPVRLTVLPIPINTGKQADRPYFRPEVISDAKYKRIEALSDLEKAATKA